MMKFKNGYSMIVLIITIAVIIILAASAITMMSTSREESKITDFIYDLTTIEDLVQSYYTKTGTLPVETLNKIDIDEFNAKLPENNVPFYSQLSTYDNENYYDIDLKQLGAITLRDSERGYFVNEGSLKVYVKNGITDSRNKVNDKETIYYTLTQALVNGKELYSSQDEEIIVVGNPITWTNVASLRAVLPREGLIEGEDSFKDWTFKWDYGPKTAEQILESTTAKSFKYGAILAVKSNGVYSIYAQDPNGKVTVVNVNVTKIDDISPKYRFINPTNPDDPVDLQLLDDETGIKSVRYKKLSNYKANVESSKESETQENVVRNEIDYFLYDGEGKDLIHEMQADYNAFIIQRDTVQKALEEENDRFDRWNQEIDRLEANGETPVTPEEKNTEIERHDNLVTEFTNQLTDLLNEYSYFVDLSGQTDESRLVLYVEDYSGNAIVVGVNDVISTSMVAHAYNLRLNTDEEA